MNQLGQFVAPVLVNGERAVDLLLGVLQVLQESRGVQMEEHAKAVLPARLRQRRQRHGQAAIIISTIKIRTLDDDRFAGIVRHDGFRRLPDRRRVQ